MVFSFRFKRPVLLLMRASKKILISKYSSYILTKFPYFALTLYSLMTKFSKKLVSKCIYIEILKCSETDLLCQFMQAGGWTLVHLWLTDAIASQNWPLVHEILELLLLCPVDVERLKSNTAPKLVKQLTKDEHPAEVKLLAETLVQQWLRIVRGEALPSGNTSTSENEDASQDVPGTKLTTESVKTDEVAPVQEKIVLKLSVKDGKNVIIRKNEEVAVSEKSSTEAVDSDDTESVAVSESKSDESMDKQLEKKLEKDKKKSSSTNKSSSNKTNHSSSHKSSSSSSSSKHKSSSGSKDKDKDKERDRHKSSSHKSSSSSKSSSLKKSSRGSERENKKDKEPEMSEADKVAKTLAELEPEKLTKLGKIPKKSRDSDGAKGSSDEKKTTKPVPAPALPKVKPTFSIEERDPEKRAKTVKTLNSKFRSHGLEEEAPPPPSRKILKKPSTLTSLPAPVLTTGIKRVSPPRTSIGKDPALSPPVVKKPKLDGEGTGRPNGLKIPKPKSRKCPINDISNENFPISRYRQRLEKVRRSILIGTHLCCWHKRKAPHWFILHLIKFFTSFRIYSLIF